MDFNSYLKLMVHKKASDLFITAGLAPSIKIHGRVIPITQQPLNKSQARDMVTGIMSPYQKEEFERTHECNFAIGVSSVGRFRVSAFYQRNAVGMVIRRVESKIPTFEKLKLPEVLKELTLTKRGIIIFVGGTGTGKSTSLAAMIGYRNVTQPVTLSPLKTPSNMFTNIRAV
jgi:Tfp pilus assembly protein, ATPase PilU